MSVKPLVFLIICFVSLNSCSSSASKEALQVPNEVLAQDAVELTTARSSADGNDDAYFTKNVLVNNLYEPTEFEVMKDGSVLFIQRRGEVRLLNPDTRSISEVAKLDVNIKFEDGLMGLALDPNYYENHWIYLYYSLASENPNANEEDYIPTVEESKQHLSRFVYKDGVLDLESEIIMLKVQTQRNECCHTGGSIEFGPDGNLFLSTGDNVNPFASDGFGPFDEQPGREPWDGQMTSANTNDLRGKILRITPQPDGTYTIPEGNLFPVGTEKTRPEIYVMGNRNPYRISIDQRTGYLYWGEVGPDANENNPDRGPRGHDEINQARAAGNFGWPLFVADNKAYNDYDFATQESGEPFDPIAPINDSPNNTGLRELPPTQKAFIWYPYAESPEFPMLGSGGRNAMAGPVYYKDDYKQGAHSFPDSFDGRLFIFDWIRGWIMTVTMDENGDLVDVDPFMADVEFKSPIDMQFDDEGVLYVLEYGNGWFSQNQDARISRIEYNASSSGNVVTARAASTNEAPAIEITLEGNQSFYFGNESRSYEIEVSDPDLGRLSSGEISASDVAVRMDYLPIGYDQTLIAQGHQMVDNIDLLNPGKQLMDNSDCAGCHALDRESIGPTYLQVAGKYANDENAKAYLMDKVKNGGGGVWGEQAMAAHPQLSDDEVGAIVDYILSLTEENGAMTDGNLGVVGSILFDDQGVDGDNQGQYVIQVSYAKQGNGTADPISVQESLVLQHPIVQAESFSLSDNAHFTQGRAIVYHGSHLVLEGVDLTGIQSLAVMTKLPDPESTGGLVELRLDAPDGSIIGQLDIGYQQLNDAEEAFDIPIESTQGIHDLYIVTRNPESTEITLLSIEWVRFDP